MVSSTQPHQHRYTSIAWDRKPTLLSDLELVAALLEEVAGVLIFLRSSGEREERGLLERLLRLRHVVGGLGVRHHSRPSLPGRVLPSHGLKTDTAL